MFWAVILTFTITSLLYLLLFTSNEHKKDVREKNRLQRENDDLLKQIMSRREKIAYDRGLYNGRGADALYRQCLQKFRNRQETNAIMNGEEE